MTEKLTTQKRDPPYVQYIENLEKRPVSVNSIKELQANFKSLEFFVMLDGYVKLLQKLEDIHADDTEKKDIVFIHGAVNIGKTVFSNILKDILVHHGYKVLNAVQLKDSFQDQKTLLNDINDMWTEYGVIDYVLIDNFNLSTYNFKDMGKIEMLTSTKRQGPQQYPRFIVMSSSSFYVDARYKESGAFLGVHFTPTKKELEQVLEKNISDDEYKLYISQCSGIGTMKIPQFHLEQAIVEMTKDEKLLQLICVPIPESGLLPIEVARVVSEKACEESHCQGAAQAFLNFCQLAMDDHEQGKTLVETDFDNYRLRLTSKMVIKAVNDELLRRPKELAVENYNKIIERYQNFEKNPHVNHGAIGCLYEYVVLCKLEISQLGLRKTGEACFHPNCEVVYADCLCGSARNMKCSTVLSKCIEEVPCACCMTVYLNGGGGHQHKGFHFIHVYMADNSSVFEIQLIHVTPNPAANDLRPMKAECESVEQVMEDFVRMGRIASYSLQVVVLTLPHLAQQWTGHTWGSDENFKILINTIGYDPKQDNVKV